VFLILLFPAVLAAQVVAYDFSPLYENASPAVVQIITDDGSGSGFLVTPFGHIATNFHVIRNSRYLAVQFHDGRKARGEVIAVNTKYDMALLKVNSSLVRGIRPLQLLPENHDSTVKVGIPVVALGSPLNQKFLMTQGILSKVEDETLLGDFLLQAGNSGGPLLNMNGQVLGINTFGEGNISGAVRIDTLRDLLKTDDIWKSVQTEPSSKLLPSVSAVRYPVEILNAKVLKEPLNWMAYRFKAGDFSVTAITPVLIGKLQSLAGRIHEENPHARRIQSIPDPHSIRDEPYYEWHRATESALDYAVTFDIRPNTGLLNRSRFSTLTSPLDPFLSLFGKGRPRDIEFKGEFLDFRVYRDGKLVEPVLPGRQIIETNTNAKETRFVEQAYAGRYVYLPDEFMTGTEFRLQIVDGRKPEEIHKELIFNEDSPLIRQIRADFTYSPGFFFVKVP